MSLFQWAGAATLVLSTLIASAQSTTGHPKVVVISLDAFAADTLHDPLIAAPTLHALMGSGAYARSMQPINPTVTWPNHTAMVTGQNASHHHVLMNRSCRPSSSHPAEVSRTREKFRLSAIWTWGQP